MPEQAAGRPHPRAPGNGERRSHLETMVVCRDFQSAREHRVDDWPERGASSGAVRPEFDCRSDQWRKTSWYRNNGASDEVGDFDDRRFWLPCANHIAAPLIFPIPNRYEIGDCPHYCAVEPAKAERDSLSHTQWWLSTLIGLD